MSKNSNYTDYRTITSPNTTLVLIISTIFTSLTIIYNQFCKNYVITLVKIEEKIDQFTCQRTVKAQ